MLSADEPFHCDARDSPSSWFSEAIKGRQLHIAQLLWAENGVFEALLAFYPEDRASSLSNVIVKLAEALSDEQAGAGFYHNLAKIFRRVIYFELQNWKHGGNFKNWVLPAAHATSSGDDTEDESKPDSSTTDKSDNNNHHNPLQLEHQEPQEQTGSSPPNASTPSSSPPSSSFHLRLDHSHSGENCSGSGEFSVTSSSSTSSLPLASPSSSSSSIVSPRLSGTSPASPYVIPIASSPPKTYFAQTAQLLVTPPPTPPHPSYPPSSLSSSPSPSLSSSLAAAPTNSPPFLLQSQPASPILHRAASPTHQHQPLTIDAPHSPSQSAVSSLFSRKSSSSSSSSSSPTSSPSKKKSSRKTMSTLGAVPMSPWRLSSRRRDALAQSSDHSCSVSSSILETPSSMTLASSDHAGRRTNSSVDVLASLSASVGNGPASLSSSSGGSGGQTSSSAHAPIPIRQRSESFSICSASGSDSLSSSISSSMSSSTSSSSSSGKKLFERSDTFAGLQGSGGMSRAEKIAQIQRSASAGASAAGQLSLTTLFRNDSTCNIILASMARRFGNPYLRETLSEVLSQLYTSKKLDLELDPNKRRLKPSTVQRTQKKLLSLCSSIIRALMAAKATFPVPLLRLYQQLSQQLTKVLRLTKEENTRILQSTMFLRWVCPFIISSDWLPQGIVLTSVQRRNCILVGKVLQSAANNAVPSEVYLECTQVFIRRAQRKFDAYFSELVELVHSVGATEETAKTTTTTATTATTATTTTIAIEPPVFDPGLSHPQRCGDHEDEEQAWCGKHMDLDLMNSLIYMDVLGSHDGFRRMMPLPCTETASSTSQPVSRRIRSPSEDMTATVNKKLMPISASRSSAAALEIEQRQGLVQDFCKTAVELVASMKTMLVDMCRALHLRINNPMQWLRAFSVLITEGDLENDERDMLEQTAARPPQIWCFLPSYDHRLAIRSQPSVDSAPVAYVRRGTEVSLRTRFWFSWVEVKVGGVVGWCPHSVCRTQLLYPIQQRIDIRYIEPQIEALESLLEELLL